MDTASREANMKKYNTYKELFPRLNRALKNEFYFEAIVIAYAIVEDRTESVLRHLGKWEPYAQQCAARNGFPSITGKISRIKKEAKKASSPAARCFSDDLLDQFLDWKELRNDKIHALMNHSYDAAELKELAETGKDFARTISNRTEAMKRAIAKAKAEQE